jgi:tetratricopeptide (TPR) repeat protein
MIESAVMMGLFWIAGVVDSPSDDDLDVLNRAETAFLAGVKSPGTALETKQFHQAAECYEELHRRGVHSSALFMNQGNAYLLAGNVPEAILAYRRGLRLNPDNRQVRANLAFARDQVVYSSADNFARPPESYWPPWLPRLTVQSTFWLTFIFYALAWIGLAWQWMMPLESRRWIIWVAVAGTALFGVVFALQMRAERSESEHPVVILAADQTYLQKGNHSLYPRADDTPLNRGVEARLVQFRGNWLQIELAGGQIGWVERDNALVDLP